MMMFIWGFLTGIAILVVGCAMLVNEARRRAPAPSPANPEKLATARKYLTVIAAGETLSKCQIVANKALKETA